MRPDSAPRLRPVCRYSQALRQSLLKKYAKIRSEMDKLHNNRMSPYERLECLESIRSQVQGAWRTDEIRRSKPSPQVRRLPWPHASGTASARLDGRHTHALAFDPECRVCAISKVDARLPEGFAAESVSYTEEIVFQERTSPVLQLFHPCLLGLAWTGLECSPWLS
jgi:Phosphoenolpyruvate carboxylase